MATIKRFKQFNLYLNNNNLILVNVAPDGHCLINSSLISIYGNTNKYLETLQEITKETTSNIAEWTQFSQSSNIELTQASTQFTFNKIWNHEIVDIMPTVLSKIYKKQLIIYKFVDNQTYDELTSTYDINYTEKAYLYLENSHYQAILNKDSTIINKNLSNAHLTNKICKNCGLTGHSNIRSNQCTKNKKNFQNINTVIYFLYIDKSIILIDNKLKENNKETSTNNNIKITTISKNNLQNINMVLYFLYINKSIILIDNILKENNKDTSTNNNLNLATICKSCGLTGHTRASNNNCLNNKKRKIQISPEQIEHEKQLAKERQAKIHQTNFNHEYMRNYRSNLSPIQTEIINEKRRESRLNQSPEQINNERIRSLFRRNNNRTQNGLQQVNIMKYNI